MKRLNLMAIIALLTLLTAASVQAGVFKGKARLQCSTNDYSSLQYQMTSNASYQLLMADDFCIPDICIYNYRLAMPSTVQVCNSGDFICCIRIIPADLFCPPSAPIRAKVICKPF
ncbi:hypothetical protein GFS24_25335 [Chitinophaga sp. SYP-B3965]|uniref:hypothetical protein n=1 Tax=Chitinophaga sp. SYP-B3965 TaxID=2663120 RepID=UPI001299F200|nr:hypothetical protein [Chitinophaga sp. SYP-B3965]MRG48464.1 hypothetical protein [Chitinophaga sp. SYP-B3965]